MFHSLRAVSHNSWILSMDLLPTCSALRASMNLASACQVRAFIFAFGLHVRFVLGLPWTVSASPWAVLSADLLWVSCVTP